MKKTIILLCFAFYISSLFAQQTTVVVKDKERPPTEEIRIKDAMTAGGDQPQPRSFFRTVEAIVNNELGQVEVYFNRPVGVVNITITNEGGQIVGGTVVNTNVQSVAYLPIPEGSGLHIINLMGSGYQGSGTFFR